MFFVSTRGKEKVTGPQAVVQGMAADGGLYVPEVFPTVDMSELEEMCGMDFAERASFVLEKFFDEYDREEFRAAVRAAYAQFEGEDAAPLVRMDNGMYMLELFHGATCSVRDASLAVLPYLIGKGRELLGVQEDILVIAASGGDAGSAALERFRDMPHTKVMVFYPEDGVSKMQKLQLATADGGNVNVVAVRGDPDECRMGARRLMRAETRKTLLDERGYLLSYADANFGAIAPLIACCFSAYCDLLSSEQISYGQKVDFCAPTGNFSNVLAAYYAKRMGLPVGTIVCGVNRNSALADFFASGNFNAKRSYCHTMSSAIDVAVPSELERYLFDLSQRDASLTADRMRSLAQTGKFAVSAAELAKMRESFSVFAADEDDTVECIYDFFTDYGYPMDTHTGVAMNAAQRFAEKCKKDDPKAAPRPMVVVSTASPYKFPQDVLYALTGSDVKDSFKGVKRIHLLTAMKVPESLKAIRYQPPRFKTTVGVDKMLDEVKKFL